MTRFSWHRFRSNQVRLWLSLLAYNLGNSRQRLALPKRIENRSLTSFLHRLVKAGGRLVKHVLILLAAFGGELRDETVVWEYAREGCCTVTSDGIAEFAAAGNRSRDQNRTERYLRMPDRKGATGSWGLALG